jgi:hypothetical protein
MRKLPDTFRNYIEILSQLDCRVNEENAGVTPQSKKLLDQVRDAIRRRHYAPRTEDSYVHWIGLALY